ncbi:MAG: LacI family DNA-binding transcriptional regulator [Planctomycetota bacterium]|jgi:DNA-binding LacI/PurR family transcriptional regulator
MKPKNASLKDVAEQAGVSKSTASRILIHGQQDTHVLVNRS